MNKFILVQVAVAVRAAIVIMSSKIHYYYVVIINYNIIMYTKNYNDNVIML